MSDARNSLRFLPVSLNITGKKILIVGGGKVASHKLAGIKGFSDQITVLAPYVNEDILNDPLLIIYLKKYEKRDLENFDLVYACTNNETINATIKKDASSMGILVNVADKPELCDFFSPAVYREGVMTIAVSSGARDVKRAVKLRNTK